MLDEAMDHNLRLYKLQILLPFKRLCSGAMELKSLVRGKSLAAMQGENQEASIFVKLGRRRKFAVFLSYSGKGYKGMQW